MDVLWFLLIWYLIGAGVLLLICVGDYLFGDPDAPTTLDRLGLIIVLPMSGPVLMLTPLFFLIEVAYKKMLNGRNPKDIVLYRPRGRK